jgi:hypothetical protein
LQAGAGWYIAAVIGVFLTAVLFLKVGASLFFGPLKLPAGHKSVRRANAGITVSAAAFALLSLLGAFSGWAQRCSSNPR